MKRLAFLLLKKLAETPVPRRRQPKLVNLATLEERTPPENLMSLAGVVAAPFDLVGLSPDALTPTAAIPASSPPPAVLNFAEPLPLVGSGSAPEPTPAFTAGEPESLIPANLSPLPPPRIFPPSPPPATRPLS